MSEIDNTVSRSTDTIVSAVDRDGLQGRGAGQPEVIVLDDTIPPTSTDLRLMERELDLEETIRFLQDSMAEWIVISDPVTA